MLGAFSSRLYLTNALLFVIWTTLMYFHLLLYVSICTYTVLSEMAGQIKLQRTFGCWILIFPGY